MVATLNRIGTLVAKPRPELMGFAARLRELRKAAGFSQQDMAEACGWGKQGAYAPYELAQRDPTLSQLRVFAKALGVQLPDLLREPSSPYESQPVGRPASPAPPPEAPDA